MLIKYCRLYCVTRLGRTRNGDIYRLQEKDPRIIGRRLKVIYHRLCLVTFPLDIIDIRLFRIEGYCLSKREAGEHLLYIAVGRVVSIPIRRSRSL